MTSDVPIAIDDPTRDRKIIMGNIMREVCLMDKDTINSNLNVFSVSEIRDEALRAFSLECMAIILYVKESNAWFVAFLMLGLELNEKKCENKKKGKGQLVGVK